MAQTNVTPAKPTAVTIEQRRAVLQKSINWYTSRGFRVVSQTDTTAQLVKPKQFSCLIATLSFLLVGIGLLIYVFIYMASKDQTVYITIDENGKAHYK